MPRATPLLRSVALPVVVTTGLLLLVLASMLLITTRSLVRMTPLQEHLVFMQQVHDQILSMQHTALRDLDEATPVNHEMLIDLKHALVQLAQKPAFLTATGREKLVGAQSLLEDSTLPPRETLQRGITLLHEVVVEENRAHAHLLHSVQSQARLEMHLAAAALILIPLAAGLVLYLLRRRFLLPLDNINTLLTRLGDGSYAPANVTAVDPVLEPLIANYNRMVARLASLEAEQQARQASLESEVRLATRELLAHNRSLAQAERLAAVGEMAAGLAHELRNPLAGIQFALANLHRDLADKDARERLDLVGAELRRVTDLMNGLLDQSRLVPETATPVNLARTIGEVLTLTRYQVPANLIFEQAIPNDLRCWLPENRLRQALLNLALNAAQAMTAGGKVLVSAQYNTEGKVVITVTDQGTGFPESMLRDGVRQFASARPGGNGLGLASVRRLAQDLGGTLEFGNVAPHGARISLLLPCHRDEH